MKILDAEIVTSAASAEGLPRAATNRVALAGRSNVGKSSLINALVRRRLARTSRAPGKTRLINIYRIRVAAGPARPDTIYLVDLPGYGYTRGGRAAAHTFAELTEAYFGAAARPAARTGARATAAPDAGRRLDVLLLVDARHPGLEPDRDALAWLKSRGCQIAVVGTKADTLTRAARARTQDALERALETPVLLVSAKTGEGMSDLWKLITGLAGGRRV